MTPITRTFPSLSLRPTFFASLCRHLGPLVWSSSVTWISRHEVNSLAIQHHPCSSVVTSWSSTDHVAIPRAHRQPQLCPTPPLALGVVAPSMSEFRTVYSKHIRASLMVTTQSLILHLLCLGALMQESLIGSSMVSCWFRSVRKWSISGRGRCLPR